VLSSPLIMLMGMQEQLEQASHTQTGQNRQRTPKFPESLKMPVKELEILKARIRVFWTLRQMIL